MNVYKMNDCDWMAADSPGDAVRAYAEMMSSSIEQAVRDEVIDNEIIECSLDEEMWSDWCDPEKHKTTFRAVIEDRIAHGMTEAFFIASTEF